MPARLLSLLALLAMFLMPLGMSAPAAAAVPQMAHEQHCPPNPKDGPVKAMPGSHCVAGCTLLLPQPAVAAAAVTNQPHEAFVPRTALLHGLEPELGTPPPKFA